MSQPLSSSATVVQKYLEQHDVQFNVIELSTSTRTAQEAAHSIGCSIEQIV